MDLLALNLMLQQSHKNLTYYSLWFRNEERRQALRKDVAVRVCVCVCESQISDVLYLNM